jgi:hypothetical protein
LVKLLDQLGTLKLQLLVIAILIPKQMAVLGIETKLLTFLMRTLRQVRAVLNLLLVVLDNLG